MADKGSGFTRRTTLVSGAAGGAFLLSSAAHAQSKPGQIKTYPAPRRLKNVEHAIVYRREKEFAAWPHTHGLCSCSLFIG